MKGRKYMFQSTCFHITRPLAAGNTQNRCVKYVVHRHKSVTESFFAGSHSNKQCPCLRSES